MKYSMSYQEHFVLDDGTVLDLRAIQPSDKSALDEGFGQLTVESRRQRFFIPKSGFTDKELRYFTECDGVNHYAIVAFTTTSGDGVPKGVGVARIVRTDDDPMAAELAIVIVDSWQRRGIGRLLLECIVASASERSIKRICATALADNHQIRGLLEQYDDDVEIGPTQHGVLQFTLAVPPPNRLDALHAMINILRLAAFTVHTLVCPEILDEES
jgi:GNAT superfamily N-acetyltransferase